MRFRAVRTLVGAAAVAGFWCFCVAARADNWPQWRGPHGNGICDEKAVPNQWGKTSDGQTENIAWRVKLPGRAGASPVVWGDCIFLTSVAEDDDALLLMCFGTDGQPRWKKTAGRGNQNVTLVPNEGNSASPSPSTDGKNVWAFFGTGILVCYDFDGNEIWKLDIQERYGKFNIQFGMSSTPVLDGNRLYLQLIHGDGKPETREAAVVCLDKATGKQIWRQERPSPAYAENEHSYASPTIYRDDKQAFLLTHGADYLVAHSLDDGHELWRSGGLQPAKYDPTLRLVSSPVAVPGLIVAPSAKGGNVIAVKPGGSGDITGTKLNPWQFNPTPDVPSPLIYDGVVYLYRENGVLLVLDAKTGEKIYDQRTKGERNRASPVWADGNVYLLNRNGMTTVVKAGPKFEQVATNELGEITSSSPAFSNGHIYIRTFEALWAIGK
ncbi:MAG: outer membrane protein assembly factor BamB family protein [Planctomycetaceae bacterium]